jgi:hypothetical protein
MLATLPQNKTKKNKKKKKAWMPWVNATSPRWQQRTFFLHNCVLCHFSPGLLATP